MSENTEVLEVGCMLEILLFLKVVCGWILFVRFEALIKQLIPLVCSTQSGSSCPLSRYRKHVWSS